MQIREIMHGRGWMPFKIIHQKTCEVMGLELGSIHLGYYDGKRGKIDLLLGQEDLWKPYMSLTEESAIPMHTTDPSSYSVLTKMYAVAIFNKHYKSDGDLAMNCFFLKSFSGDLGITVPTLKNWIKKYS